MHHPTNPLLSVPRRGERRGKKTAIRLQHKDSLAMMPRTVSPSSAAVRRSPASGVKLDK